MASVENGATRLNVDVRYLASDFSSDDKGTTLQRVEIRPLTSLLSGFSSDDNGTSFVAHTNPDVPGNPILIRTYYKMRGRDLNCVPKTYRVWVVMDTPDSTGAQYAGPFCGVSLNLTDIVVLDSWQA